jgi:hypothetical protein
MKPPKFLLAVDSLAESAKVNATNQATQFVIKELPREAQT